MKNNITELVFILDRSGSMSGLESDTIGGFNSMLKRQREQEGDCYVSTVLFDNLTEVVHDRVKLSEVSDMTGKNYVVRGSTALLDAVGDSIRHINNIHKYARPEDVPENTVFVIITDGMENSSHKYTTEDVKKLIEQQKEKCGWEFMFLGANIDAVETAGTFGICPNRAVNYNADSMGTACLYDTVSMAVSGIRKNKVLSEDWCEQVAEDYNRRGR